MTIALFMLAAVSPCAVPTLCPTRKEIILAIMARNMAGLAERNAQEELSGVVLAPARVTSVSDLVCGDGTFAKEPRSTDCKFTVRYKYQISYAIATLVWQDGKWVITDYHHVWRNQ